MDGLLLVLRVHVEDGVVRTRQVAGEGRPHVSRQGLAAHTRHRGQGLQGRQGQLVVQRVRLRHELHTRHCAHRATRGRGRHKVDRVKLESHQGDRLDHNEGRGFVVQCTVSSASETQRLCACVCHLL